MQNENYYFFREEKQRRKKNANDFYYAKRKKFERRRDDGSDDSGRSRYEVGVGDANDAGAEIRVRRLAFFFVQAAHFPLPADEIFVPLSLLFFPLARKKCA